MCLYTQQDPIGIAGGLNLYGYANGDPINFSDPFGLNPCLANPNLCILAGRGLLSVNPLLGAAALGGAFILSSPSVRGAFGAGLDAVAGAIGNAFAEEAAGDDAGGAKSADEYDRHVGNLADAQDRLGGLREQLENASGPRRRRPLQEQIDRLQQEIKGHEKEIRQKWPLGRPGGE